MKTEFNDRSGKSLYTGDIVQYRLSLNSKRGGPVLKRVIAGKYGVKLVGTDRSRFSSTKHGLSMAKTLEQYVTIVDTSEREA